MKKLSSTAGITSVLAVSLLLCAHVTMAAPPPRPVVGSIDFGGSITFDTTSLATATEVMNWNSSFVLQGSGDFQNISFGTHSAMVPQWTFNQGTPSSPSAGPATPSLWSVGGFTFDLASAGVLPGQTNNFLHVTGTGTVTSTDNSFAATPGLWSFTVSDSNGQDQTTFGFQANATAVPEAGTESLIVIGAVTLAGIGWSRRKPARKSGRGIGVLLLILITCAFSVRPIEASTIQGKIDFGGTVTYDTNSLATATQISQWNNSVALQTTGDFSNPTYSIDSGDPATMVPQWIFNSGTPATPAPGPATNALWSIGGFTFDLSSCLVMSQSSTFLDVEGSGTITGNGFDPTPGAWSFTSSRSDGGTASSFGFQAQSSAVPEPSSTLLLATGGFITVFCLAAKRRQKAPRQ